MEPYMYLFGLSLALTLLVYWKYNRFCFRMWMSLYGSNLMLLDPQWVQGINDCVLTTKAFNTHVYKHRGRVYIVAAPKEWDILSRFQKYLCFLVLAKSADEVYAGVVEYKPTRHALPATNDSPSELVSINTYQFPVFFKANTSKPELHHWWFLKLPNPIVTIHGQRISGAFVRVGKNDASALSVFHKMVGDYR